MSTTKARGPRAYVADFQIALGPINTIGKLVKVTKTGADEYKEFVSVCPECSDPTKPKQTYVCDQGHSYTIGDLRKAKDVDGTLHFVDKDEIDAAKKSDLPLNVLRPTVHPVADVWNNVWDSDNAYVFLPRIADEYHALLVRLIQDSGRAFVGMCNLRNNEGFFRLDVWQGHIVVQKVYWPGECNEFEPVPTSCDDETYEAAVSFIIDRTEKPFVPDEYQSTVKARLLALTSNLTGDPGDAVPVVAPAPKESLLDALRAFGEAS